MNTSYKKYASVIIAGLISISVAVPAFAQENGAPRLQPPRSGQASGGRMVGNGQIVARNPSVAGKDLISGIVTGVTGTMVTVTVHQGTTTASATTTYTVDASTAVVYKNNATSSVSSIVTGDRVLVIGTISGTSVTAKIITDLGKAPMREVRSNIDDNGKGNLNQRPWSGAISATSTYSSSQSSGQYRYGIQDEDQSQTGDDVLDFSFGQDGNQGQRVGFFKGIGNFFKRIFGLNN